MLPHFEEEAKKRQSTSTGGNAPQLVELVPQANDGIKSRDQAGELVEWMIRHQLGRRNLSPGAARILRGKLYNSRKKGAHDGGAGKARGSGDQIDPQLSAAEIVAKETGVSPATIKRDATFADDVEAAGNTAATFALTLTRNFRAHSTISRRRSMEEIEKGRNQVVTLAT